MSTIIYSTELSSEIRGAYNYWASFVGKTLTNDSVKQKNAAFLSFCNACEKEGRHPLSIVNKICKTQRAVTV